MKEQPLPQVERPPLLMRGAPARRPVSLGVAPACREAEGSRSHSHRPTAGHQAGGPWPLQPGRAAVSERSPPRPQGLAKDQTVVVHGLQRPSVRCHRAGQIAPSTSTCNHPIGTNQLANPDTWLGWGFLPSAQQAQRPRGQSSPAQSSAEAFAKCGPRGCQTPPVVPSGWGCRAPPWTGWGPAGVRAFSRLPSPGPWP